MHVLKKRKKKKKEKKKTSAIHVSDLVQQVCSGCMSSAELMKLSVDSLCVCVSVVVPGSIHCGNK